MKLLYPLLVLTSLLLFFTIIIIWLTLSPTNNAYNESFPSPFPSPSFLTPLPSPTISDPPDLSPSFPPSPSLSPSPNPPSPEYLDPTYKKTLTTVFWVGEAPSQSNAYIPNDKSSWDSSWQNHYGGIDDPQDRCGYQPCSFIPKENPFYFALPYNDLNDEGLRKKSASNIPWFTERSNLQSVLKNSWIAITYQDQTCYAQWEDVGPYETDDFDYVFSQELPDNQFGLKAGLDISPAVRDCLKMTSNDIVFWKFIADKEVPDGPWKKIISTSNVSW